MLVGRHKGYKYGLFIYLTMEKQYYHNWSHSDIMIESLSSVMCRPQLGLALTVQAFQNIGRLALAMNMS